MGAFLGILNKIGFYRIRREQSTCTNCKICDKACPVNVHVSVDKAVRSAECINCLECVTDCPTKKRTLVPVFFKKVARPVSVAALGLIIYIGTIGASKLTGNWQPVDKTLSEKAEMGVLTPDDIKGSNSIREVIDIFGLDVDELYNRLGISHEEVPENTKLKDIKNLIDADSFEAEEVRLIVKDMLGLPVEIDTGDQPASYEIPSPDENKVVPNGLDEESVPAGSTGFSNFNLEGTMSIQDVAGALGADEQQVIEKLGLPPDIPKTTPLRDLKDEYDYTITHYHANGCQFNKFKYFLTFAKIAKGLLAGW